MKSITKLLIENIRRIVVEPCLEEEEPYAVRSRKLAVIAFSFIAINALIMGIPIETVSELYDPSLGRRLSAVCGVYVAITSSIVPYIYLRTTRKLPDWVVDLQMWSVMLVSICFALFVHNGSTTVVFTVCMLVGIVMRVRAWQLLLLSGACIIVINALINDFAKEIPALHETFYHSTPLSIRVLYLLGAGVCPPVFFGFGLQAIVRESVERANQADAAIAMNLAVADKLRRYDTNGVAVILAANKGKVDEKLLEAFTAIQHNLEEYRPHIPDYVIAATTSTEDNTEDSEDDDEGAIGISDKHSLVSSCLSESNSTIINSKRHDDTCFPLPGTVDVHSSGNNSLTPHKEGSGTSLNNDNDVDQHNVAKMDRAKPLHYSGRVTTVYVRFVSVDGFVVTKCKAGVSATMSTLSNCVDAASKHAKTHKGALQYMQGCGLIVSFNAASRVATHEANACAFALALKTSVSKLLGTDLVMHATIVTTNVLSFFAGNSGQLMLTVLGGFMPVHTAMHHYLSQTVGKAASCVLLSDGVVPTIDMMFDHRLLGGVVETHVYDQRLPGQPPVGSNRICIGISELLAARRNNAEEWLYQAKERDQNDPITRSNTAVRIALDGDAVPIEFSTQCDTSDVVLMKCVKERLETCRAKDLPFEVRTTPTVMW